MATLSFAAQVDAWCRQTEQRMEAVFKESTQRVIAEAQKTRAQGGRMRVDTGFLRASGQASRVSMPTINRGAHPSAGGVYPFNDEPVELVIAGAELGDTIYFGYTAAYAAHREYGANGQPPDAFVRTAAQRWQPIVDEVVKEARARARR